jgi:hypothetical protein
LALRFGVKFGLADNEFHKEAKQYGTDEPDDWRKEERIADLCCVAPINSGSSIAAAHQCVGHTNANDGADQSMRARCREAEPRFQMIAAMRIANTIANPASEPTCRISSTGNNETMPKATAPVENRTPRKLKNPDQTTATGGASEWV